MINKYLEMHFLLRTAHWVFSFNWRELDNFAFVNFFRLLDAQADGSAKVLHEDLSLLDLCAEHFRSNHRAEGDLVPQFLGNGHGQGSFACSGRASEEDGSARHPLGFDQINNQSSSL